MILSFPKIRDDSYSFIIQPTQYKMKSSKILWITAVVCLPFFAHYATAQVVTAKDSTQQWHISTLDGNDFIGELVSDDESTVTILTDNFGEIKIPKKQIKVMEPVRKGQMVKGSYWYDSPHNTRYFFAPNGYGLKKGEGYYQNTWVFMNQVTYGFTDHFSLGVGLVPTFLFGASGFPFWVTPKFSLPIQKEKLNLGAGVLYFNGIGEDFGDTGGGAGLVYGTLTAGPRDRNITMGLGWGFAEGDWGAYPAITISGMYRQSRNFYFLTENYIIPLGYGENVGIVSVGGRYMAKRVAIDFGLFRPVFSDDDFFDFIGLPWLGVTIPFGRPR